ncbi:MAG TPA: hypothetical protein VKT77_00555, partial [Chthonomonadaceae bacterium]|nr:hypothetical protein [Chthonomonadaceae bacterium]
MRLLRVCVRPLVPAAVIASLLLTDGCGCGRSGHAPADYQKIVSTFTIGSIALQTNDPKHVPDYLTTMTQLAPEEPAGWANLALYQLRRQQLAEAGENLKKAHDLGPPNAGIEKLLALLADQTGDLNGAASHIKKAVELAPGDLKARYALSELDHRLGTPEGDADEQKALQGILDIQPYNLKAQAELARVAARRGDSETCKKLIAGFNARASTFEPKALEQLKIVNRSAAANNWQAVAAAIPILSNTLQENSAFSMGAAALMKASNEPVGDPILQFIVLPPIAATPAPPDTALAFAAQPLMTAPATARWSGMLIRDKS